MADPNTQLPALPAASTTNDTDLYHVRQGSLDKKIDFATLKAGITAADVGALDGTRAVNTTAPLTGGGALSSDLTLGVSAATTTASGVVELATPTETQTGTDGTRAVTPSGLASLTANESRKGLVELADSAETTAQLSNLLAISPANLKYAFTGSKLENGYMKLPNGWIIQWGIYSATGGVYTANFNIPFPSACIFILGGVANAIPHTTDQVSNSAGLLSNTQFRITTDQGIGTRWIAIGY